MTVCPHCGLPFNTRQSTPLDEYYPSRFCYDSDQCARDHAPPRLDPLPPPYWQENGSCCPWLVVPLVEDGDWDSRVVMRQDNSGHWWRVTEDVEFVRLVVPS